VARVVVELVEFKGAWVARRVEHPSGDVLFVRKSSLRDKSQFSALHAVARRLQPQLARRPPERCGTT
jgi:hypothetical protein